MWSMLAAVRRNLQNMRKSPRVADETMFGDGNIGAAAAAADDEDEFPTLPPEMGGRRSGWGGFSVICSVVVRAPLALLSCLSHPPPHINGVDGVWVSGEVARISEMNHHLVVNDSLRYAILM